MAVQYAPGLDCNQFVALLAPFLKVPTCANGRSSSVASGTVRATTGVRPVYARMGLDAFVPIAPARVNVLVIPAGNVRRLRFAGFVSRLGEVQEVALADVSPRTGSGNSMFAFTQWKQEERN